jgi:cytochrome c-type protein NapC
MMTLRVFAAAAGLTALLAASPADADGIGIDWSSVAGKEIVLFYPGQSSWEWSLTQSAMSGAKEFREGKDCDDCHIGEEKTMGPQIASGQPRVFKDGTKPPIEPAPIAGKRGYIPATVKFANDGVNLYVHIEFAEGPQPDAKQDPQYATKVTVMFNDGGVPEANRGGCFAACHDDSNGMPSAKGATRTMYLPKTRVKLTRQGGGDTLLPADDLAKLRAGGYALEFWEAKLNPDAPPVAADGVIFDKREEISPTVVTAQATQTGGVWSVTLGRKLDAGAGYKTFSDAGRYTVSVAIHAGHTAHRFHYVSFERTLRIDAGSADFVAVRR